MDIETARNFLIALLIGALIGLEREKRKGDDALPRGFAGIRTHILFALAGAASAWLTRELDLPYTLLVTLGVVGAIVLASHRTAQREGDDVAGLTSEVAAIAVCLLGAMSAAGEPVLAAALAVVVSAVLAYKQPLHGFVARIGIDDLYAGIKLLIASCIVLPLLPDETVDPWQALNPYKLWLLVVMISALSLAGYVAVRWLGTTHGSAITGVAGGVVSSTATTLSFARTSRAADGAGSDALAAGMLLAWAVMLPRVAAITAVVNPAPLRALVVPLVAMALVKAGFAFAYYRAGLRARRGGEGSGLALGNPFSLSAAVKFGAVVAAVMLAVKLVQERDAGVGTYVVAALGGIVNMDAITVSLAGSAQPGDHARHIGVALGVAILSSTVFKTALVIAIARGALRWKIAIAAAAAAAVGALAIAWNG